MWEGQLNFTGGTPIIYSPIEADTGVLDFSVKMSFTGSVQYCVEALPVPEPASIALALSGLVALLALRRKFA